VRRNLFFFAITWAMVVLLVASCATKNGRVFMGGGWTGPLITGVSYTPATGPYYSTTSVVFTVAAQVTGGGTLTYSWDFGTWATITAGAGTSAATATLDTLGAQTGTVTVTETLDDGTALSSHLDFDMTVEAIPNLQPVLDSLTAAGNAVTAVYHDPDGDNVTATWSSDMGSVTPGASSNTGATCTFVPPAGQSGTATITLTIDDGVTTAVTGTVTIDFLFDPFAGASPDSVFLLPSVSSIASGSNFDLWIYCYQNANPLANINSLRIIVTKADALAKTFAFPDPPETAPGGFYYASYDGAFLSPPILPTDTDVDLNISWGGETFQQSGATALGLLGTLTFKINAAAGSNVTFDISPDTNRTYYSDTSATAYNWAVLGKDYGSGLTSQVSVAVS